MSNNPIFATLMLQLAMLACASAALAAVSGTGTGLSGFYYDRIDPTGHPTLKRLDPLIDFSWTGGPAPGIPADNFSVRWMGSLEPRFDEAYTLHLTTDDGVRLWIDGALAIDAWYPRTPTESTTTFAAHAGQRYAIRIDYFQATRQAVAIFEWSSAHEPRAVVPTSALYAMNRPLVAIPAASLVSPVSISGQRQPGTSPTATDRGSLVVVHDVGETGFYLDARLSADHPTAIAISDGGTVHGTVTWSPLDLTGLSPDSDVMSVRVGDHLLVQPPAEAVTLDLLVQSGTGPSHALTDAMPVDIAFPKPGVTVLVARDAVGDVVGGISVRVVGVSLGGAVPIGIAYTRLLDLAVVPLAAVDAISLEGSDAHDVTVAPGASGVDYRRIAVTPLVADADARVLARLSPDGPVIGTLRISPFMIDTSELNHLLVDPVTRKGHAEIVIRPFIHDEVLDFHLFAHTSTFLGGAKSFSINTSDATSSLGEPGFHPRSDPGHALAGAFDFTMIMPLGETMYCLDVTGFAGSNAYQVAP